MSVDTYALGGELFKRVAPLDTYWIGNAGSVYTAMTRGCREQDRVLNIPRYRAFLEKDPGGYLCVKVRRGGVRQSFSVARLVLEHFVGPPPSTDSLARHLNDIRTDNRATNLAWGDWQETAKICGEILRTTKVSFDL